MADGVVYAALRVYAGRRAEVFHPGASSRGSTPPEEKAAIPMPYLVPSYSKQPSNEAGAERTFKGVEEDARMAGCIGAQGRRVRNTAAVRICNVHSGDKMRSWKYGRISIPMMYDDFKIGMVSVAVLLCVTGVDLCVGTAAAHTRGRHVD